MKKTNLNYSRLACAGAVRAGTPHPIVEYKQDDTTLEGFVAYDDAIQGKRPGVLVVHQWLGLTGYGKETRGNARADSVTSRFARTFTARVSARKTRRKPAPRRANTKTTGNCCAPGPMPAWTRCGQQPLVDSKRSRQSANCFRRARPVIEAGAQRSGRCGRGEFPRRIGFAGASRRQKHQRGKVLVCHGADDPSERPRIWPHSRVRCAMPRWIGSSSNTAAPSISFTQPMAGNDNSKGAAYNERRTSVRGKP